MGNQEAGQSAAMYNKNTSFPAVSPSWNINHELFTASFEVAWQNGHESKFIF